MKVTKITAVLAVAGALALSGSANAQTANTETNRARPSMGVRGGRMMSVDAQLKRIDEAVTLTDEQKPKVKAALEEQAKALQEARNAAPEDRRAKFQAARTDFNKKLKEILTPEQYAKLPQRQGRTRQPQAGAGTQ